MVDGVDLADRTMRGPPSTTFWTRAPTEAVGADQVAHQALLAYATDLTVIGTALRPHVGFSQADAHVTLHTAVTGHHDVVPPTVPDLDDWCLVSQQVR